MTKKLIVRSDGSKQIVDYTPEEEAQRLVDAAKSAAARDKKRIEKERRGTFADDARMRALADRLATSNSSQIHTFFGNNVTTATQAINVLEDVVKLMAYQLRTTIGSTNASS